jgi:hypothetical protein
MVWRQDARRSGRQDRRRVVFNFGEAIAPKDAPKIEPNAVEIDENAPPTRSELEQKAAELGLKFDGRTSDNKLGQKIQEFLGA